MKILIANGCSHTAGTNIDPDNLESCKNLAWPRWVSEHYDLDCINLAEGGSGNEQISRTIILVLSSMLSTGLVAKDTVVAIAWSGFDRYEFWSQKTRKHMSVGLGSTMMNYVDTDVKRYVEARSLIEFEEYANYKNLYYIYTTALYLESQGIKYIFSNALRPFKDPSTFASQRELRSEYVNLINLYGARAEQHLALFDNTQTLKSILKDTPCSPLGDKQHWSEQGQKKYAEYFIQHVENHGGLAHLGEH